MTILSTQAVGDTARRNSARSRVLDVLRRLGPQSRAALGRIAGLSPASISAATSALIAEGILVEAGTENPDQVSGPGRPGTLVRFNPDIGCIIGLWIGLDRISLQLSNFLGEPLSMREERLALSDLAEEALVATLAARVAAFRRDLASDRPVLGLGIAFQGYVDRASGRVVWSPVTRHVDMPLASAMEDATGLPVEIDNDASAMAQAIIQADRELQRGVTACVMLGDGVGLGVFVDGQPLRGAGGAGVEFGHVQLDPTGPQCRCGARGCVESYLADYALFRDAMALSASLPPDQARQPGEAAMTGIVAAAAQGDPAMLGLLDNAGRQLAQGVTTLIHLFQPRSVVFCGPGVRAWPFLEGPLRDGLRAHAVSRMARLVTLSARPFRLELMTEGVILAVLARIDRVLADSTPANERRAHG